MRLLTSAAEIDDEFRRLLGECDSCQIAVAWATAGHAAFDSMIAEPEKIDLIIVGTHNFYTDPKFIEAFVSNESVRFVVPWLSNGKALFHPKAFTFVLPTGVASIVGSSNFTAGGFRNNDEIALLIDVDDAGGEAAVTQLHQLFDDYASRPYIRSMNRDDLAEYRRQRAEYRQKNPDDATVEKQEYTMRSLLLSVDRFADSDNRVRRILEYLLEHGPCLQKNIYLNTGVLNESKELLAMLDADWVGRIKNNEWLYEVDITVKGARILQKWYESQQSQSNEH